MKVKGFNKLEMARALARKKAELARIGLIHIKGPQHGNSNQ